jgi:hypothetical protein
MDTMASGQTTTGPQQADREEIKDRLIAEAEEAEREHGGASRQLFDLRTIIGTMFLVYGVYLTIRGITDAQAAIDKAAGVRINLWTGLAALVMGVIFLAWALLRPITIEETAESQAEAIVEEREHEDAMTGGAGEERERDTAGRFHH